MERSHRDEGLEGFNRDNEALPVEVVRAYDDLSTRRVVVGILYRFSHTGNKVVARVPEKHAQEVIHRALLVQLVWVDGEFERSDDLLDLIVLHHNLDHLIQSRFETRLRVLETDKERN